MFFVENYSNYTTYAKYIVVGLIVCCALQHRKENPKESKLQVFLRFLCYSYVSEYLKIFL